VGAEALLRWHHPVRGEIRPEAFIPLAEDCGLIVRIGEWVLREACRQAAQWPRLRCMAVNVSPVQFRRPGFVDQVKDALARAGIDAGRLELEITEGVLLHETDETLATLLRLHTIGVTIAMDDFGTGYSSLGYLQKFPFDKIKIDQSFVKVLQTDSHAAEIVRAVLRMGHAMGIRVNAEGVEQESQASILLEEGCEEVQGFLFSRGLDAEAFSTLLARTTRAIMPWEASPA
jgi:EAL domain-containing protein (putative c-di-GMP-specific phosphodiesterase class I)